MSAAPAGSRLVVVVQDIARHPGTPGAELMIACLGKVFGETAGEVTVRIVDEAESAALNARYRQREGPTNVLAFATEASSFAIGDEPPPLGDLVICAPVVAREALEQDKPLAAHWAHMLVHGGLHLRGYDHISRSEAVEMETAERVLLAELGIADPYGDEP